LYKNKLDHKKKCHEFYLNHKEEILKRSRKRYLKKRDDLLKYRKEHSQKPEVKQRIKEYQKRYRDEHKEEIKNKRKGYQKQYYLDNRDEKLAKEKLFRKENADRINARKQELRKLNPDRFHKYDKKHYNKRKHLFNHIPLLENPYSVELDVDFHHVYPQFPSTVPMPRKIHQTHNMELEKHIEHNKDWFEKLYGMDVDCLLGLKPFN